MVVRSRTSQDYELNPIKLGLMAMFVFIVLVSLSILFTGLPVLPTVLAVVAVIVLVIYIVLGIVEEALLRGPSPSLQELVLFIAFVHVVFLVVCVFNAVRYTMMTWNNAGVGFIFLVLVYALYQYGRQNRMPVGERSEWLYTDPFVVLVGLFVFNGMLYTINTMDWAGLISILAISEGLAFFFVRRGRRK